MEDASVFVEVVAPLAFFQLPWKLGEAHIKVMFETQWAALRKAILCIIRPVGNLSAVVAQYREAINKFAEAANEVRFGTFIPCFYIATSHA